MHTACSASQIETGLPATASRLPVTIDWAWSSYSAGSTENRLHLHNGNGTSKAAGNGEKRRDWVSEMENDLQEPQRNAGACVCGGGDEEATAGLGGLVQKGVPSPHPGILSSSARQHPAVRPPPPVPTFFIFLWRHKTRASAPIGISVRRSQRTAVGYRSATGRRAARSADGRRNFN